MMHILKLLQYSIFEAVGDKPIQNQEQYTQQMKQSIFDKLFFLELCDCDCIVDFGCADAFVLSQIRILRPNLMLIGYDLDDSMLDKAKSNLNDQNSLVTSDWSVVESVIQKYKKPLLLLSSVIHEVYSYSSPNTISNFWKKQVFSGKFHFICIRDMIPDGNISKIKDFDEDVSKIISNTEPQYLKSFEEKWGLISQSYRVMLHFLLKYRYKDNWKREVEENYLPISLQTLNQKIPTTYKKVYESNYIYDYLKQIIKQDFDITINGSTHTKMILEKI